MSLKKIYSFKSFHKHCFVWAFLWSLHYWSLLFPFTRFQPSDRWLKIQLVNVMQDFPGSIIYSMDMSLSKLQEMVKRQGNLACCSPWGRKELDMTGRLNNNKYIRQHRRNIFLVAAETLQFYQHQGNWRLFNLGTPKSQWQRSWKSPSVEMLKSGACKSSAQQVEVNIIR